MASPNIVSLTPDNFQSEVTQSAVPVLVDFWAEWCGPCKMIAPVLDELATEFAGKAKIAKLNVDNCPDLASKFKVTSIPMFLMFKGGQVVGQHVGAGGGKPKLKSLIDGAMA
jgi:thioredoxin 1